MSNIMFKQFYGSKNAYDRMQYMPKGSDIEPGYQTQAMAR